MKRGSSPGLEHPGQVVQRRVGVGAADRLDERADDVVVLVALPVVAHGCAVDGRLGRLEVDGGQALALGGARGRLEIGQRTPRVAAGEPHQVVERLVVDREAAGQAALVDERQGEHRPDVVVGQRLQAQQQAAGEQRRDHREERVLGGGGDQGDPAVLHAGQQGVLLRLGEAVDLVDEQHRLATAAHQLGASGVDGRAHLLHPGGDGRDLDEVTVGLLAQDRGDGGLAGAGRPPEQQRHRLVALDQLAQRRPRRPQLLLADQLVERPRPHPHGQRRRRVGVARQRPTRGLRALHPAPSRRTAPPRAQSTQHDHEHATRTRAESAHLSRPEDAQPSRRCDGTISSADSARLRTAPAASRRHPQP